MLDAAILRAKRSLVTTALAALIAAGAAGTARAGSCPADKIAHEGAGQPRSEAPAAGVTDDVVVATDLEKEPVGINDRLFRLRKLVVRPGGVVPWHSHGNRPAIIYIVSGEITEYASSCAVPILHKAGEAAAETHVTSHWWKNLGRAPAVLLSADLFPVKADSDKHMM